MASIEQSEVEFGEAAAHIYAADYTSVEAVSARIDVPLAPALWLLRGEGRKWAATPAGKASPENSLTA